MLKFLTLPIGDTGREGCFRLGDITAVTDPELGGEGCVLWLRGDYDTPFHISVSKEECIKRMRDLYERGD